MEKELLSGVLMFLPQVMMFDYSSEGRIRLNGALYRSRLQAMQA